MATYAERLTLIANNTGSFRTFVSASEAAFSRMGWVNTNASGTINFATVVPPSAANQLRGYSVWRFNDASQTTAPVFIKVQYGSDPSSATNLRLTMQAAKQTDNSGSIFNGTTNTITTIVATSTTSGTMVASGDTGWGWLGFRVGQTQPVVCGIERGRNQNGGLDASQLYLWSLSSNTSQGAVTSHFNWNTGSVAPMVTYPGATAYLPFFFVDDVAIATTTDSIISFSSAPAALMNMNVRNTGQPITMLATKRFTSDPTLDVQTIAPYGTNIQYINLGNQFATVQVASPEFNLLLRWE